MCIAFCRAARQYQAGRTQFQQRGDLVDMPGRDAGFFADTHLIVIFHQRLDIAGSRTQRVDNAQRQDPFGSRTDGHPAICVRASQGHLRLDLDQDAALAIHTFAELSILL